MSEQKKRKKKKKEEEKKTKKRWPKAYMCLLVMNRLVGPVVKASASRAEDPGFEGIFRVKSYQWLKNWHSSGYLARRQAL